MSLEGFSALEKTSQGWAARPVGYSSTLQIVMVFWRPFFNLNLPGRVRELFGALKIFIKVCQTAITIRSRLPHPTRLLSIIVCRGQEAPKGCNGTLRADF
jgi:hypothetical protein